MTEKSKYTAKDRLMCLFRREFFMIIPNYVLFLIPVSSLMAYLAKRYIDTPLGWKFPIPQPYNYFIFAFMLVTGFIGLLWVYSYLILEGEGGPCPPFTSKTKCLVKTGPYALSRHPSILVKLYGVVGLGIAFQSLSFIIIVIPILLTGSLYNNTRFQEKPLIEKFGDEYLEYKKETPILFPDLWKLFGWK